MFKKPEVPGSDEKIKELFKKLLAEAHYGESSSFYKEYMEELEELLNEKD